VQSDRTVTRLTPGPAPAIHRYYDVPVEEPPGGGGRILYFRFDSERIPGPGTVVVADADGGNPVEVGRGEEGIGHVGAGQTWVAPGRVAFSPRQQSEGTSVIVDVATGEATPIESNIRSVCEATAEAVIMGGGGAARATRLDRIQTMRMLDLASGVSRPLLAVEQAWSIHPRKNEFEPGISNFQNPKFSPDGRHLFVVFGTQVYTMQTERKDLPRIKSLILMDTRGEDVVYLGEFGHHPMWLPDGSGIIAYCNDAAGRQDLMRFSLDGGGSEMFVENLPGMHCSSDRAGRRLVTDVFGAPAEDQVSVILVHLADGRRETLAAGRHAGRDHMTGCHPHPQWSRDESRIFFNHPDSGAPQLYAVSV
jgi:hypothetical protein